MYRGREGMWSWVLHRIAGVAIFFFLVIHIADTSFVTWGPKLYNEAVNLYGSAIGRMGEIALIGAVLFHAINGVRIIIIDFVPRSARYQRQMFHGVIVVFLAVYVPAALYLFREVLKKLG